ncbi:MAG: SelT/SelW/SelH family protein [Bacillota bacterium]
MDRAVALAKKILNQQKNNISELAIIPSQGGVFEIKVNDKLLFSKAEFGRFPEEGEAEGLIKEAI